jgi:hypothetical protein
MRLNPASSIVFAITTLVFAARIQAQREAVPAPAAGCTPQSGQLSCLSIANPPAVEFPAPLRGIDTPGSFTLFGPVKGFALVQTDLARTTSSFGPTWRVKAGLRYETPGGVQFSASASARRGYSLPIAMLQPLGSDVPLPDYSSLFLQSGASQIHWDTELRVRKALISSDALDLAVIGEAFNLVNVNPKPDPAAKGPVVTSSPTVRGGLLLGF